MEGIFNHDSLYRILRICNTQKTSTNVEEIPYIDYKLNKDTVTNTGIKYNKHKLFLEQIKSFLVIKLSIDSSTNISTICVLIVMTRRDRTYAMPYLLYFSPTVPRPSEQ